MTINLTLVLRLSDLKSVFSMYSMLSNEWLSLSIWKDAKAPLKKHKYEIIDINIDLFISKWM